MEEACSPITEREVVCRAVWDGGANAVTLDEWESTSSISEVNGLALRWIMVSGELEYFTQ